MPSDTSAVTAVVRRRIRAGCEGDFESLMQEFITFVLRQPGHIAIQVIRPQAGSRDYTVLDRFATEQDRKRFVASEDYTQWMNRLRSVSEADPEIEEQQGIAFWFDMPDRPHRPPPPRVKMALLTWLGVFPLSMIFPALLIPLLPGVPRWLVGMLIAASIVVSLTWVVMPALTRLFEKWLFPSSTGGSE